jgi:hypothetical protein
MNPDQKQRLTQLNNWIRYSWNNKGSVKTANDVWEYIERHWPKLSEANKEELFQHSK